VSRESVVTATGLLLVSAMLHAQAPLEFEVASIKRNTTNTFASGPPPNPASGQLSMTNVPVQSLVLAGYPLQTIPVQVVGLPDWAASERYDVVAKGKPAATLDERQEMWRALLAERLKLQAHYETRERAGYNLVFARTDKRLGPQLQPSTLDCTRPPPPFGLDGAPITAESAETMAMARCTVMMISSPTGFGLYTGGTSLANLLRMMAGSAGRPIVDRTGLEGNYSVRLKFAREGPLPGGPPGPPPPPTEDAPSLFTAIQEQLGLKLEPTTMQGQVLVIDHIERPTEN
jgi:uncharacterized protein (TIGR03435 family)